MADYSTTSGGGSLLGFEKSVAVFLGTALIAKPSIDDG